MVNKVTFVGFRGEGDHPNSPTLDPPLLQTKAFCTRYCVFCVQVYLI